MSKGPGKNFRKGITLIQLMEMFPDEDSAVKWFESIQWGDDRCCGHCGSVSTKPVPGRKPMPYWCQDCRSYFSVRTGTTLQNSRVPLRKWAIAIYLYVTSLKGISSMKLHRDIGVTQKTAWYMLHRLREAWGEAGLNEFVGPVEVDETYMGGKRKNMPKSKRKELDGRGVSGKTAVVGIKDRKSNRVVAKVVKTTDKESLQGFIGDHVSAGSTVYTDEHRSYLGMVDFKHESVKHSVGEYVRDQAHTNGIESFWSLLKRAHTGTFHKMSEKHLQRYVVEFYGRHGVRSADTKTQMMNVVSAMVGKRLAYRDLIA